jgi:outer membrane receptor protein involved in Fe transport
MKNLVKTLCCLISALLISSGMQAREIHHADSVGNAGWTIQNVDTDLVTTVKEANFINSLSGKVAGLIINPNAAGLGSASRISMRGPASINGYDPVLIVIDGIPMHNASSGNMSEGINGGRTGTDGIADINPEDIESISVISGPSASVLY